MSIFDFDRLEAIQQDDAARSTDSGKVKPKSLAELNAKPLDSQKGTMLSIQNTVLYFAHEIAKAARLARRKTNIPRFHNHIYYMFSALYLGDDRGFYNRCVEADVPFWVRYAWLFAMLCFRDEDDLCLMGPVDMGLVDGMHSGNTRYGYAHCKADYVNTLLFDVPLVLADTPSECLRLTEQLHARFEDTNLRVGLRVVGLDVYLFRRAKKPYPNKRKRGT